MSIFGTILAKILHHDGGAPAVPAPQTAANDAGTPPAAAPAPTAVPSAAPAAGAPSQDTAAPASVAPASTPAAAASVDVGTVLDGLAGKSGQTLDWKHSIVDMMKLLDMDSSLSARKQLAEELHYSGDMSDSASMNMWLHKEVMAKLAANGGKLPADLKA